MINILVSVKPDLASSIAIRYAGQLSKFMEIGLQPIHVKEPDNKEGLLGTGWVRHTWEHALTEKGVEEINQLIWTEKPNCPSLAAPRVVVGDREEEILQELQVGDYDLFMEGMLASFNISDFQKLVKSKLYQNIPCPMVIVKNLIPIEKFALLTFDGVDARELAKKFIQIFGDIHLALDILHYETGQSQELEIKEGKASNKYTDTAMEILESAGWSPTHIKIIQGPPQQVSEYLADYALIGSSVRDGLSKRNSLMTVLARTPSPIFLV